MGSAWELIDRAPTHKYHLILVRLKSRLDYCLTRAAVLIPSGETRIISPTNHHQHRQPVFQVWSDSSPSPDTLLLLPSGINVSGIETWVRKLAEVA